MLIGITMHLDIWQDILIVIPIVIRKVVCDFHMFFWYHVVGG